MPPEELLPLFNEAAIFRALPEDAGDDERATALLDACRDRGLRTEQARLAIELERALRQKREREREPSPLDGPGEKSPAMQHVLGLLREVAPHKASVLLQGETGSGKEVLARKLHGWSDRAAAPFVVQDCGVLAETLLESELFGHVKGAFTGAHADHPGLFVLADGGTVFLDEIENTTPALQAKLLRVLETGEVRPVGGARVRTVDVRVVAASNADLLALVRDGRFRGDLYYRLATFPVDVPPLRRRREEILPLARHFLAQHGGAALAPEAEAVLLSHDWPGNIRELRNVVERAAILARGATVGPSHLPEALVRISAGEAARSGGGTLRERLEEVERRLVADALDRAGGVRQRAAADLGVDAVTRGRRARRLGVGPWRATAGAGRGARPTGSGTS